MYRFAHLIEKVSDVTKMRNLNTLYFTPPKIMAMELMTDGYTAPEILLFLSERFREVRLEPYVACKESTGFLCNLAWAAIKRELLMIVTEGVADPETPNGAYSLQRRPSGRGLPSVPARGS